MKKQHSVPVPSISEQHRLLGLPKPQHPLVSAFDFDEIDYDLYEKEADSLVLDMYCISLKRTVAGKMKYGQGFYDFDEGLMSFTAPKQVVSNLCGTYRPKGWCVVFHPDFIRTHALGKKMKEYGFFSYATNEALHLSEKEETTILSTMQLIRHEIQSSIDKFSEQVIISYIEVLLSYSDRFYHRQFLTRKTVNHDLLTQLEHALQAHFNSDYQTALPTVEMLAAQLNVSAGYLSDMLRSLTGQTAQQHIHNHLIERAKEMLSSTNLSVSEIAYQFGFEYPQSFNKLFKNKTNVTPLQYRQSFN